MEKLMQKLFLEPEEMCWKIQNGKRTKTNSQFSFHHQRNTGHE
jgi:hypothetical protein